MDNQKTYKPQNHNNTNMLPGDPKGLPDDCFSDSLIFIDVGFLEILSKYFGKGKYLKFDRITFAENLCKKENIDCKKIFYYTAPPFQPDEPTKEHEKRKKGYDKFTNKLRKQGVIIREGRCQRLKINGKFIYKQKAVDSLMIMDLMRIPLEYPKIKKIIILASDSDFVPVIKYLTEIKIQIILYTHYSRNRKSNLSRSNELLKVATKYVEITKQDFDNCPLEND